MILRRTLSLILFLIIIMELVSSVGMASSQLPPLYVEDAVNSQIKTLWSQSPTGIDAFHEAPSVNNSFWIDDNAKFLESIAPWWQSYSSYVSDILQFIQEGDVNGLFIKRFEYPLNPVQAITINGLSGYTNGFYDIVGNPLNNTMSIRSYYNPTLAVTYLYGNVVQYPNGILVNMESGLENPIVDGGFGGQGGQNPPWVSVSGFGNNTIVQIENSAKTYLDLIGTPLFGSPSEELQFNLPIVNILPHYLTFYDVGGVLGNYNYKQQFIEFNITLFLQSSSINRVYLLFVWENSTSGTLVETNMPVYFTANGQWQQVVVTVPASVLPKYWNLGNLATVPLLIGIGLDVPSASTGNTGISVGSISTLYPTVFGPTFNEKDYGSYVVFNESWHSNYLDATFWLSYILGQGDAIMVLASAPINNSWIYVGFNGLATIGTGYTILETPNGTIANHNNVNNISWAYLGDNFGRWFLLSVKYAPNWIGDFQLLSMFPMAGSSDPYIDTLGYAVYMGDPTEVRNTLYFGNYTTLPGYFQWVEVAFKNTNNGGIYGFFLMPSVDYLVSPNTIVNDLFPSNFTGYSPSTPPNYYWNAVWGENYYEGEIIYALALLGKYGNSQALSMAEQAWSAYYNQLNQYNGSTYTSSLARYLMATILLNEITGNSQYSNAYTTIANWLLQWQNQSKYVYVHIPMWYHKDPYVTTVNGYTSYGYIINETSKMDVGTVISGTSIALNFYEDIPLNTSYGISLITNGTGKLPFTYTNNLNVSGTLITYIYLNGGGTATTANITITVQIAYNGQILQTIGTATVNDVQIQPGGSSGSPPYYPVKITVPVLTTVNAPPSSTLVIAWNIKSSTTVYALIDSTNGPSNVTIPLSWKNPFYGEFTIPQIYNPNPGVHNYPQPYFLDVSAISGQALMMLYDVTHNPTYLEDAELVEGSIHYSEIPTPSYSVLGVNNAPVTYRLWVYGNYSTVDADYYTYKAELVSEFADAVGNNTLASLAISRVWQRTEYTYPTSYIYYVSSYGSGLQMNSETQPWGDVATQDYVQTWAPTNLDLYWASLPKEDWIINQTWNGTALKIYLYSYYENNFQLLFLTPTVNFNVIINGNYTNYGANHQILEVTGNAKIGTNVIIIVPNPTNQTSINTGTGTTTTSPVSNIFNGFNLTPQEEELFGFIVYFTVVGLTYLFSRNKTITTLGSLVGVVIIWALGLWPMYMLFLVGAVSLFMMFYTIREGGGEEDGY
ncbi:putative end-filament protein [Sulfolobus spindle-shaped virus 6]|uniref:Putative end-filament protein n=1 Tax=Sulfolobus spindle-shaped virus 6 TaxID=693627 RepID=D1GF47_9VIRU|nr:putative end-filament protein [Sulfolobus spindle-shaped virus 6]ACZ35748.1 putative end-filament protein [Sulfolobus spindle-shaped virus 6]